VQATKPSSRLNRPSASTAVLGGELQISRILRRLGARVSFESLREMALDMTFVAIAQLAQLLAVALANVFSDKLVLDFLFRAKQNLR
jgi:hypothetical protein